MSVRYSVVIPTLNEAPAIAGTIDSVKSAFGSGVEILVVDGGSTDDTCAAAERAGAKVLRSGRGRGRQLRAGVQAARGNVLLMLHADTRLPADARTELDAALENDAVVGGAFRLKFERNGGRLPLSVRLLEPAINARSRAFGTATGDQAIFARREAIAAAGGVPDVPLFEDVRFYRALRRTGRVVLLNTPVTTSPRLWLRAGPVRVILLHLAFRVLHALGTTPHTLARWYAALSQR